ncbi:16S rRNA processing protein RimM [Haloactinopolyspora alba]|uniref:Ribosome maturation factor RimM n=1 Tax=Haloactinopolyspora alba TaxID=648780 RepID=A0A2P8DVD2_9ACTN|nr:ribosome maturation factor RimM [Haloactinopolyspora alba]PSL01193.1 16S rRNA processing protein RimM [Haloactinopolyspora alba]
MIVTVGRIGRAHGVRGEVAVEVRTDDPDERFAEGAVLTTEPPGAGPLTVRHARWHGGRLLVRFDATSGRDAAEALRGTMLQAEIADDARPDDPDEFYDHQLVGLWVVTTDGAEVGTVGEVVHTPAQELLAVRREAGGEVLVPFVAEIVPEVDLSAGRVVVDPPAGLLDDAAAGE